MLLGAMINQSPVEALDRASLHPRCSWHLRTCAVLGALALSCAASAVTKTWVGVSGGSWQSSSNWSPSGIPGANDDVVIANPGATVIYTASTSTIKSLSSAANLNFNSGRLIVTTTAHVQGLITINGGWIEGGEWTLKFPILAMESPASRLRSLTLNGDIVYGSTGGRLKILDVVLNGTAQLTGFNTLLTFEGTQTFTKGTIEFLHDTSGGPAIAMETAGTLTLAPEVLLRGGTGSIGNNQSGTAPAMTLINQGVIRSDSAGRSIEIKPASFLNQGTVDASLGTIRISSPSWTSPLGILLNSGGELELAGTLECGGGPVSLQWTEQSTGFTTLSSGRIQNGTLVIQEGRSLQVSSGSVNRFANLEINGDLALSMGSSELRLLNVILNGSVEMSGSNSELLFEGTQTFSTGTVICNSTAFSTPAIRMSVAGTLTLGADVLIQGGNLNIASRSGGSDMSLISHATIVAEVPAKPISINPTTFINHGEMRCAGGELSCFAANWTNVGGQLIADAGVFSLGGVLDNSGATLPLTGTAGAFRLNGGTITGGVIDIAPPLKLLTANGNLNRLTDTTVNGVVEIGNPSGASLAIKNVVLNGTILMTGQNSSLLIDGSQAFTKGTIEFAYPSSDWPMIRPLTGSPTLTLGRDVVIRGGNGIIGNSNSSNPPASTLSVINHGTLHADIAGRRIKVDTQSFLSDGDLLIEPGATLETRGPWTHTGAIVSNQGTLELGGTFATTSLAGLVTTASTVKLLGTIDNVGTTIVFGTGGGTWQIDGASITGGTIQMAAGTPLRCLSNANSRFASLHFIGDLLLELSNARLRLKDVVLDGTALLSANSSRLAFEGTQVFPKGTIILSSPSPSTYPGVVMHTAGTVTFGPEVMVRGGNGSIGSYSGGSVPAMTLINEGTIQCDVAARTLVVGATSLTNTGTLKSSAGTVSVTSPTVTNYSAPTNTLAGGTWAVGPNATLAWPTAVIRTLGPGTTVVLDGAGSAFASINGLTSINNGASFVLLGGRDFSAIPIAGTFTNDGTLSLGAQCEMAIAGEYAQGATGVLSSVLTSAAGPIPLSSTDSLLLDGSAAVSFSSGFAPVPGQSIPLATTLDGARFGQFASLAHPLLRACVLTMNYSNVSASIGLENEAPLAICKDLTAKIGSSGKIELTAGDIDAGSSDNCAIASMSLSRTSFDCTEVGKHIVTLTVIDAAGNASSCESIVTIEPSERFLGAAGGSWFDAANWCGSIPSHETSATIATQVVIDQIGAIAGSVAIEAGGELSIGSRASASLEVLGAVTVESGGTLSIGALGAVTAQSLLVRSGATLVLSGAQSGLSASIIEIEAGGTLLWLGGTIDVSTLLLTTEPITVGCASQPAALRLLGATIAAPSLSICMGGALAGFGTIECSVASDGSIEPGSSAGEIQVDGDLLLLENGSLSIEISGLVPGAEFDRLSVTGQTSLSGALSVELGNGFQPVLGDIFEVISTTTVLGRFTSASLPPLPAPLLFDTAVGDGGVSVRVRTLADVDGDGIVNGTDLAMILGQWGPCTGCRGDLNGDGVVDGSDLAIVLGSWTPAA